MTDHLGAVDVAPCARTLRRFWRDARIVIAVPLFLLFSFALTFVFKFVSRGAVLADVGAQQVFGEEYQHAALIIVLAGLMSVIVVCIGTYRKWRIVLAALAVFCVPLLSIDMKSIFSSPVTLEDVLSLAIVAVIAVPAFDMLASLYRLLSKQRPLLHELDNFARLSKARQRKYSSLQAIKLLWLIPAAALGVACAAALQLAYAYIHVTFLNVPRSYLSTLEDTVKFVEAQPGTYAFILAIQLLQIALTIAVVIAVFRFFWRLTRRNAEEVIANPDYRPVVFLRSFRDDAALLTSRRWLDRVIFRKRRLEEVVVRTLSALGPPVAVGMPGERMPQLGALRAYYAEDKWKDAVLGWIQRAYAVVVVAGLSPWALWEFNHVLVSGFGQRLLLIMPPETEPGARELRWQKVCEAAAATPWHGAMQQLPARDLIAVLFGRDDSVQPVFGGSDHQVDYELAIQLAAARLSNLARTS